MKKEKNLTGGAKKEQAAQPAQHTFPVFDWPAHQAQGYNDEIGEFSIAGIVCHALTRIDPTGSHWQYQLVCATEHKDESNSPVWLHLNHDEPVDAAPGVQAFVSAMLKHDILMEKPPFEDEWAISVDDENDYDSNFPCPELSGLAIDELAIFGRTHLDSACIVEFRIKPDDTQDSKNTPNFSHMINKCLLLLDWNADVKFRLASWADNVEALKESIDHGAKINQPLSLNGDSSLFVSILESRNDIARLLLESGAEVGLKNSTGQTLLHVAVTASNLELCRLLSNPESIHALNNESKTPLDVANQDGVSEETRNWLRSFAAKTKAHSALDEIKQVRMNASP